MHVAVWLQADSFIPAGMSSKGPSPMAKKRPAKAAQEDTDTVGGDQVCLHLVTAIGPRVFRPPGPGMFAAFWDNGLPHGSRLVCEGEVIEALLAVEQSSTFADEAIKCH